MAVKITVSFPRGDEKRHTKPEYRLGMIKGPSNHTILRLSIAVILMHSDLGVLEIHANGN